MEVRAVGPAAIPPVRVEALPALLTPLPDLAANALLDAVLGKVRTAIELGNPREAVALVRAIGQALQLPPPDVAVPQQQSAPDVAAADPALEATLGKVRRAIEQGRPQEAVAAVRAMARAMPLPEVAKAAPQDRVEALLTQLATPEVGDLVAQVEPVSAPPELVLGEVRRAIGEGKPEEAVVAIGRWARSNPLAAEGLRTRPELEPVRTEVDALFRRLGVEARGQAEARIDRATEIVDSAGPLPVAPGVDTRAVLAIAIRFAESGRLADCARGGGLAELVIDRYRGRKAEAVTAGALVAAGKAAAGRAKRVWRRAPLLVLLVGWLAVGLTGAAGSDIWPIGLLGLVGLAFYARVRHVRF